MRIGSKVGKLDVSNGGSEWGARIVDVRLEEFKFASMALKLVKRVHMLLSLLLLGLNL